MKEVMRTIVHVDLIIVQMFILNIHTERTISRLQE